MSLCLGVGLLLPLTGCSYVDPAPGVGVAFPQGWQRHEVSSSVYEEESRAAHPEVEQWGEYEVASIIVGWDPETETGCAAFAGSDPDAPAGPPFVSMEAARGVVDRAVEGALQRSADGHWDQTWNGEASLPGGRADYIDGVQEVPDRLGTQYTVTKGNQTLILACYARERPDDRWLSIAETLEFLPAEE